MRTRKRVRKSSRKSSHNPTRKNLTRMRHKPSHNPTRKNLTRKSKKIRKRGGAALNETALPTVMDRERVATILNASGKGFAQTPENDRGQIIDVFEGKPEQNLLDAIEAVRYIESLSESTNEEEKLLYKILRSFAIESEHREWITNALLDYQSFRELLKLLHPSTMGDFKFPLVLTKFYQFFVLHKKGAEREKGLKLFKAGAERMLRNAITMAKGITRGPRTRAPMILFRGLNISHRAFETHPMNHSYQAGFSSTSLNEGSSRQFVRGGFMMRIHVPAGTPISCYSLSGEFEIPLPIGCILVPRRDSKGNPIISKSNGIDTIDFDLQLPADGIDQVEAQYEALIEKIWGFTEDELTEIFRRSYPEYRGPGLEQENSEEPSQNSYDQSQRNQYMEGDNSQGLEEIVEQKRMDNPPVKKGRKTNFITDLSDYDEKLRSIFERKLPLELERRHSAPPSGAAASEEPALESRSITI